MTEVSARVNAVAATVRWVVRPSPLSPVVVVADSPDVAAALLLRVLEQPDSTLSGWSGVVAHSSGFVAIVGHGHSAAPLPWADGVRYLGREPEAPAAMLLPTNLQPTTPSALLYRALRAQFPGVQEPFTVWPPLAGSGLAILSLSEARPLDRETVGAALRRFVGALAKSEALT